MVQVGKQNFFSAVFGKTVENSFLNFFFCCFWKNGGEIFYYIFFCFYTCTIVINGLKTKKKRAKENVIMFCLEYFHHSMIKKMKAMGRRCGQKSKKTLKMKLQFLH